MSQEYVAAIDQGTTGTTVLVLNRRGQIVSRAYSEFPQIYPQPGWVEHDAMVIWETTWRVLLKAVKGYAIAAIGITNQRETTVVWDRKTGEPIYHAIVWQCRRTVDLCRRFADHTESIRAKTGLVLDAYFSATKVRWILDQVPGARQRAKAGELAFGTIDSWLMYKLSGHRSHVTDFTNASRTMLFNIHERQWDGDLLDLFDIPKSVLPESVLPSATEFGTVDLAPLAGVPICGVAGDQQASMYGLHCFEAGLVKNTYGTGCFLMKYLGDKLVRSEHGLLTTLACDETGQPAYALEGSVFIAGAAIQWLRDGLDLIKHAKETEAMARSIEDTKGVYMVPAFVGLGTPYWDPDARGLICGLTAGVTRAHLVRATLESIAFQSRDVLEAMMADSGLAIGEVRVDGGASKNNFLMQFQADQLGVAVNRGLEVETTALGAALLAGRHIGFWGETMPGGVAGGRLFKASMDQDRRSSLYTGWQDAVRRSRS